jgi:hypothetical protein
VSTLLIYLANKLFDFNDLHLILMINTDKTKDPRYRVLTITFEWRKVDPPITINQETIKRYQAPLITEYVDTETGEIIPARSLRNSQEIWPTLHFGERCLQRQTVLRGIRREVRRFAEFILEFRDHRRGVTPSVDMLVLWYARLTRKLARNVRRYVKQLEEAGILAGTSVLSPLFQIAGRSTVARDHLGADAVSASRYMLMSIDGRYAS